MDKKKIRPAVIINIHDVPDEVASHIKDLPENDWLSSTVKYNWKTSVLLDGWLKGECGITESTIVLFDMRYVE